MAKSKSLCPRGTKIQSVVFSKKNYNQEGARLWLERHGFRNGLDVKPGTIRARQKQPTEFRKDSFRSIKLGPGIGAVVGCPKK